jgi:NADH-quinone oxidoreductase subunit C
MSDTDAADDTTAPEPPPPPPEKYGMPMTTSRGQVVVHVPREGLAEYVMKLRDEESFNVCIDVTAVDYLAYRGERELPEGVTAERFEVVINLLSHTKAERLRLRVQVPADDPVVPTLFHVHPGTEAMEREVYDMFGIAFDGHPDLTRILMPEDWIGHPLRKDYAIGRIPVQFKGVENAR